MSEPWDVVVVGGGHNALVAAVLLGRAGLRVRVLERAPVLGGAVRTEHPFARAPEVGQSTGAYLLGLMPPELLATLGLDLPLVRRDPHYFLPTRGDRYLLLGSDREAARRQFVEFFSEADWRADQALAAELQQLREDIGPTWLSEPLSIEETAERHVRPALRQTFVELCRGSVGDYLARFGFQSDLVMAMYAVTDGFTGLNGGWDTPGTGMNFLIHNMCRLPAGDGTWMLLRGGMGTLTEQLVAAARAAGVRVDAGAEVRELHVTAGRVTGVSTAEETISAGVVVVGTDPFRLLNLCAPGALPASLDTRIDGYRRDGTTLKLNLCLDALPEFTCLREDRGQHRGTIHILPEEDVVLDALKQAFDEVSRGKLPERPTIEWYIHSELDPSLGGPDRHSSALFVQWVPYEIEGSSWEAESAGFAKKLLALCDEFAPGTSERVVDSFMLHPQAIERHFGITRGHIHHVDNSFGFADRLPYRLGVDGLYACGAGCHPGGSVIGAAGHNAARCVLADMKR